MGRKLKRTNDPVSLRIRSLRPNLNVGQEWMAAEIGCLPNEWGDYENGKRPGWPRLEEICVRWGVSPAWIMWGVEPRELDFKKSPELRWALERFSQKMEEAPHILNKRFVAQDLETNHAVTEVVHGLAGKKSLDSTHEQPDAPGKDKRTKRTPGDIKPRRPSSDNQGKNR